MTEAWVRIARAAIAATREPHVKQLPKRPLAKGLPAIPKRTLSAPFAGGHAHYKRTCRRA